MLEKLFKLNENHTSARTESIAGLTTFMTMAYILAVNPSILNNTGHKEDISPLMTVLTILFLLKCILI